MRSLLIIFSLLVLSCENPLIYRMSADYFPLEAEGSSWEFESEIGERTLLLSGGGTVQGNRDCYLIERNYSEEYWYEDGKEVARYASEDYHLGGERISLTREWMRYVELPLFEANSWADTLEVEKEVFGVLVLRRIISRGAVKNIETVEVPAGRFPHCYKIELVRSTETYVDSVLAQSDTTRTVEWYGPDVGMVMYSADSDLYRLVKLNIQNRSP
jgi:hypothetical protein